jgi:hypothetical protein
VLQVELEVDAQEGEGSAVVARQDQGLKRQEPDYNRVLVQLLNDDLSILHQPVLDAQILCYSTDSAYLQPQLVRGDAWLVEHAKVVS